MAPMPNDITVTVGSPEPPAVDPPKPRGKDAPPAVIDWDESEMGGGESDTEEGSSTELSEEAKGTPAGDESEDAAERSQEGSAVEKSFGKLTWDLVDRLRCEGCGNSAPAPVRQCRSGHVLCSGCSKSLSACPHTGCEEDIGNEKDLPVNAALVTMAAKTGATVPCRHKACDWRVRHPDLARHEKYCVFIRKGLMSPSLTDVTKQQEQQDESSSTPSSDSPDDVLSKEVRSQLDCALCNHAAPAPVFQCRNGHVACYYCLGRLQKFDHPRCPLCPTPVPLQKSTVVRNAHLEGLASFADTAVPCRYDCCDETDIPHDKLAEHLRTCEHQPIKCVHCTVEADGSSSSSPTKTKKQERTYVNWDHMWEHYRTDHLPHYPPTSLDGIVVQSEIIAKMIGGTIDFVTWGHCLDPDTNQPVRAFPGLFYDVDRDLFYFNVRIMGPITKGDACGLEVGPFASDPSDESAASKISVQARMPPTSYRVGYFEDADLGSAARTVRTRPCLVLSGPTVRCLLASSGGEDGGSLCFRVTLPESMKRT